MVIPASLANDPFRAAAETIKHEPDHFIDALRELEEEFPATMGIAPFPEDSPGVTLREFTPEENAAFDLLDLKKNPPLYPSPVNMPIYEMRDGKIVETNLTFDDVERISERADKYDRMAASIEGDPNWLANPEIENEDLIAALRLAAKALRNGVQP